MTEDQQHLITTATMLWGLLVLCPLLVLLLGGLVLIRKSRRKIFGEPNEEGSLDRAVKRSLRTLPKPKKKLPDADAEGDDESTS